MLSEEKIILTLRSVYAAQLLSPLMLVGIFETELQEPGSLVGNDVLTYAMNMVGVVLVLCGILLGLKLMTFQRVKARIHDSLQDYYSYSLCRLALLGTPLLYNTLAYYLLGCEPTCGYLALMCVVAFMFVWPSKDKMRYERDIE